MNFTDQQLLEVWEQGRQQLLLNSGLLLLQLCYPSHSLEELLDFTIGERDVALLRLRQHCFGDQLANTAACPECEQIMEWESDIHAFYLQPLYKSDRPKDFTLNYNDQAISYRLPTSRDIIALAGLTATTQLDMHLLKRCLSDEKPSISPEEIDFQRAINADMILKDPQADIQIQLNCINCKHSWEVAFDILPYLWEELNTWALGMIREIGLLARHYSWSEQDVLAMSRFRRNLYLQQISE